MDPGQELLRFSERLLHWNPEIFFRITKTGKFRIRTPVVTYFQNKLDIVAISKRVECCSCDTTKKYEYIVVNNKYYLHGLIKRNLMASLSMYSSYTCKVRAYFEEGPNVAVLLEWSSSLPLTIGN